MNENDEIEEGELISEDININSNENNNNNNNNDDDDINTGNIKTGDVESGEITDDSNDDINNYENEDVEVLELRYEALKSLELKAEQEEKHESKLDNDETINKKRRQKKSKIKIKKRKKHKRQEENESIQKIFSSKSSSSSSLTSLSRKINRNNSSESRNCLPSYTKLLTSNYAIQQQNDNYEIQDMEIDNTDNNNPIFADKDMRYLTNNNNNNINDYSNFNKQQQQQQSVDSIQTMSIMEYMMNSLDTYSKTTANNNQNVFYFNDQFPKKYFEYQSISTIQKPKNLMDIDISINKPYSPRVKKNLTKKGKNKLRKKNMSLIESSNTNINNNVSLNSNDEDLNELRDNLLNDLKEKRAKKEYKEHRSSCEENSVEQKPKEIEFDYNHYEETINMARKQIEEAAQIAFKQKQLLNNVNSNSRLINRINPVIIKLNGKDETSSDDDDEDDENNVNKIEENNSISHQSNNNTDAVFLSNINKFLNAAKEQAKNEIKNKQINNNENKITSSISIVNEKKDEIVVSSPKKLSATIKRIKVTSKKDEIRIVRDRINNRSKEITECNKKSAEIKHLLIKKSKDINLSKEKVKLLKEQLQAAEKILQVNEEAVKELKIKQKNFDTKITKLKEMKKKQQEHLQNLLASNNYETIQTPNQLIKQISIQSPEKTQTPLKALSAVEPVQTNIREPSVDKATKTIDIENKQIENANEIQSNKTSETPIQKQIETTESINTQQTVVFQQATKAQPAINSSTPNKMNLNDLERLIENKSQIILANNDLKERIENLKLKSLLKENTSTSSSLQSSPSTTKLVNISSNTNNSNIKPKIFVSKQTNKKLEQIAMDKFNTNNVKQNDNNKENESLILKNLTEIVDNLTKNYPYVHLNSNSIGNKDLIVNKESKKFLNDLAINNHDLVTLTTTTTTIQTDNKVINNVLNYESPLLMFRGYRFNKNFCELNNFETSYSKFYCNSIDIRKPFCPFDLNGACKDSNCIYQHSSVMTMDNLQRTEHFLSYCPELIEVTEKLPQKEAIKRLRNYSKQFMSKNLNKMSIKDYFKYLYDEIMKKRKPNENESIILKRIPSLIINNNKSIGAFEEQNCDFEKNNDSTEQEYQISSLKNLDRLNKFKYKCMNESLKEYLNENPNDVMGWLFYSNMKMNNNNGNIEIVLNILSQALELNSNSEEIWLEYLTIYSKLKKLKDFNEVCLLAIDNCKSYKIFWKILLTINLDFVDEIIDRFNKYLIEIKTDDNRSFYLCELILYHVYIKITYNNDINSAKTIFMNYLKNDEICSNTKLEHNSILWLYAIYLHAFGYLPNIYFHENIPGRVYKLTPFLLPWNLNTKFTCNITQIRQYLCDALSLFKTKTFLVDQSSLKLTPKQILKDGLAIYENLINLEISLKRYDIALKICERLLQSDTTLIDIWLLKIYISIQTSNVNQEIENALKTCPNDSKLHFHISQYYISNNDNESAIKLLENLIYNYYDFETINTNVDNLYKNILNYQNHHQIINNYKLKPIINKEFLDKQLLNLNLCYCLYLTLQSPCLADEAYTFAINKFTSLNDHLIIWTRYLKFLINTKNNFNLIYSIIRKCFNDLNTFQTINNEDQLIIIDFLLKYCRTNKDKFILLKYLLELIPTNIELIKWFTNYLINNNNNNNKNSLQLLYDHLIINSIKNDSLWILCIKMCIDQNDMQQAQSIFKKAKLICENSISFKKLSKYFLDTEADN